MADPKPKTEDKPETATKPEKAEVVRLVTPVLSKDFKLAVHGHNNHDAVVPAGTVKEDLLQTKLWGHVSTKIKMHDEIRVIEANGAFMARLFVHFKNNLDVGVKVLEFYKLDEVDYTEMANADGYEVKNRGAAGGWTVIDKASGKSLFTNLESQSAAMAQKEQYVATLNR